MRFLMMIRLQETEQAPSERLMAEMGKLIDEMTRAGTMVTTAGLRPTSEGVRVRLRGAKLSTTDGPFAETKEVVGGFFIFETKTRDEAVELTRRFMSLHAGEYEMECEVRQMEGPGAG